MVASIRSQYFALFLLVSMFLERGISRTILIKVNQARSSGVHQTSFLFQRRLCMQMSESHTSNDYPNFSFQIKKSDRTTKARTATLVTPHGSIETPNFVFCATKAAMKCITPEQLREEGSQICLSNTYHLMLAPGADIVEKMGGLQKFTAWNGPMLTDSGGYQIFSMGHGSVSNEIKGKRDAATMGWNQSLINIDENGASFRSYIDGLTYELTPEKSIDIQRKLGADLIVVLDECTPFNVDKTYTADSMRRSHRWALRSLAEFRRTNTGKQALYGIIQGGVYEDLRQESAAFINEHDFFGTAIGGSLGATRRDMHDIVAFTRQMVRDDRPVHLLGIGGVRDIFHGVRQGIDTFDCVHPSRLGRHGGALVPAAHWYEPLIEEEAVTAMTIGRDRKAEKMRKRNLDRARSLWSAQGDINTAMPRAAALEPEPQPVAPKRKAVAAPTVREHVDISKARMRLDPRPIDPTCTCYTCKNFSRAYLHHLFRAREMLGGTLVTVHNVHFMNRLMKAIRTGIEEDNLDEVERYFVHPTLLQSLGDDNPNLSTLST